MKKIVIFVVLFVVPICLMPAQNIKGKYDGLQYDPAIANIPSGVGDRTALELRDYGIDLFIAGLALNYVAPPVITVVAIAVGAAGLTDILNLNFSINDLLSGRVRADVGNAVNIVSIGSVIAGLVSVAGLGMWIAGAVYWNRGNRLLSGGAVALTAPEDDLVVALEGAQISIRY